MTQVSSSAMYMLQFTKDLSFFQWSKVDIACTGPRAFHSSAYMPESNSVALVGGIQCTYEGKTVRHKLGVMLVNTTTWAWRSFIVSDDICMSSTKILHIGGNMLVYFGM